MWSPRSPNLKPCEYFKWGYLKPKAYRLIPRTIEELKVNIVKEHKNIDKTILNIAFFNFKKWCSLIIDANGGYIENE